MHVVGLVAHKVDELDASQGVNPARAIGRVANINDSARQELAQQVGIALARDTRRPPIVARGFPPCCLR